MNPPDNARTGAASRVTDAIQEAERHLRLGDLPAAIVALERAMHEGPTPVQANHLGVLLGDAWLRLGDATAARAWLDRVLAQPAPGSATLHRHALLLLARHHEDEGRPREAAGALVQLATLVTGDPARRADVLLEIARLAVDHGDPQEALHHLDDVRELLVGHGSGAQRALVEHLTGAALHAAGRSADAMIHLVEAQRDETGPDRRADLQLVTGDALAALGSLDLAQAAYAEAVELAATMDRPRLVRRAAERLADLATARQAWQEAAMARATAARWQDRAHERELRRRASEEELRTAVAVLRQGPAPAVPADLAGTVRPALVAITRLAQAGAEHGGDRQRTHGALADAGRLAADALTCLDALLRPGADAGPAAGAPTVDLKALIEDVLHEVAQELGQRPVRLSGVLRTGTPPRVHANPNALRGLLRALMRETANATSTRHAAIVGTWTPGGLRLTFSDLDPDPTQGAPRRRTVAVRSDDDDVVCARAEARWLQGTLRSRTQGEAGPRHELTLPLLPAAGAGRTDTLLLEDGVTGGAPPVRGRVG